MTQRSIVRLAFAAALVLMSAAAPCSAQKVDYYSTEDLAHLQQELGARTNPATGIASATLEKYPGHYTMIILRKKDGEVELHKNVADVFIVVDGSATLRNGGSIVNPRSTGPGEIRGSSMQGGQEVHLKKGDIVHIPANVSHQLLLGSGGSFTYFVVKVDERPAP